MRHILDTATWSNMVLVPMVLPQRIRALLDRDEIKGVCSVSLLELAIHQRHGRLLPSPATLRDFLERALMSDIELLELTPDIAVAGNELPAGFRGDPFDRAIAATARVLNLTLITPDALIRDSNFCRTEFYPFRPSRLRH